MNSKEFNCFVSAPCGYPPENRDASAAALNLNPAPHCSEYSPKAIHMELVHVAASPESDGPPSRSSSATALLAACWQKLNSARVDAPA